MRLRLEILIEIGTNTIVIGPNGTALQRGGVMDPGRGGTSRGVKAGHLGPPRNLDKR